MSFHKQLSKHKQLRTLLIQVYTVLIAGGFYLGLTRVWLAAFFILNILAWIYVYRDKRKAINSSPFRIPENTFLLLSLVGGSVGTILAMYLHRHKTKHIRLVTLLFIILLGQILIFVMNIHRL